MGSHFSYGDVVSGGFFYFTYYVGYEEIIQVVILGGWVFELGLVVVYVVEIVSEDESVGGEKFSVLYS